MSIDNTAKRMQEDPDEQQSFLLAESVVTGSPSSFIERQERDGQRQLVNSDRLPTEIIGAAQAEFEALGFTFGEPDPDDPLFRPATLPEGWKREGSDHDMWSYVVDPIGRRRAGVFYKAAFYDRRAHMDLVSLGWYITCAVEYDAGPIIFDDEWASRKAVAAEMQAIRDGHLAEAAKFRGFAANESRSEDNRRHCAEIAQRKETDATKYEAALSELAAV